MYPTSWPLGFNSPSIATSKELLQVPFASLTDGLVDLAPNSLLERLMDDVSEHSDGFRELGMSHAG